MDLDLTGTFHAPVAQWIRASVFGTEGRRFESYRVYQFYTIWVSSSAG